MQVKLNVPKDGEPLVPLQGDSKQDLRELVRMAKGLPADPLDSRTDPYKISSAEDHSPWIQELDQEDVGAER